MNQVTDANISIFKFFNNNFGQPAFHNFLNFINAMGDPHLFYYHFSFIFAIASLMIYLHKDNTSSLKNLLITGTSSMLTLASSLAIGLVTIVGLLKRYTQVARPHCSLDNINVLHEVINSATCEHSFPSGHIAFSVIMIASFWPLFNRLFKTLSIIFLCILLASRMASGAHYPMDLFGSIAICLPLTLYLREKISKIVITYEARWDIFKKIFKGA